MRKSQPTALPSAKASHSPQDTFTIEMLYEDVKRLNMACVAASGGVSGSPDCELAVAKEEQLEGLGYCIDYPNGEALILCSALSRQS